MTPNLTDARRRWLSELYEANSVAVFNLCRRLLNSREDAADATHEVFLRAAASLSEPPSSPQARGWLMTVARNYCIDLLRRRERFGSAMTTLAATADATGESVETVEDRQLLLAIFRQLGVREREALWQSAVERRPLAEIARSLGLSYMAAAKLLSRARRQALVLATRLAVILGLVQLGRAARRSTRVQLTHLAAVVVVPLLIAAVVVSSSTHSTISAHATASRGSSAQGQALAVGHRPAHVSSLLPGTGPSTPPTRAGLVAQVPGVQTPALRSGPTRARVNPSAIIPVSNIASKHGKVHDRADAIHHHHHRGHGKARGHGR